VFTTDLLMEVKLYDDNIRYIFSILSWLITLEYLIRIYRPPVVEADNE
jgi:hypothetical protein